MGTLDIPFLFFLDPKFLTVLAIFGIGYAVSKFFK